MTVSDFWSLLSMGGLLAAMCGGCFAPDIGELVACGEIGMCPAGMQCDPQANVCRYELPDDPEPDARADAVPDAEPDAVPDAVPDAIPDAMPTGCGDGTVDDTADEQCDDGNIDSGDGCSPTCTIEVSVAAGSNHTCAVVAGGGVRCWGRGEFGALGYGDIRNVGDGQLLLSHDMPIHDVQLGEPAFQVAVGDEHSCALLTNGDVRCWGSSGSGQLGQNNVDIIGDDEHPDGLQPVALSDAAVQIAAGAQHSCAIVASGEVFCWGHNEFGQLGLGNSENIGDGEGEVGMGLANVAIAGPARKLALGEHHTCVLLANETVQCWGRGQFGQHGHGRVEDLDAPPPALQLGDNVTELSAGRNHTCALLASRQLLCWGQGAFGALGYGNPDNIGDDELPDSSSPVPIGDDVVGVAAGGKHTCAIMATGTVSCFGSSEFGQLGYSNIDSIGDDEPASAAGDVVIGGVGAVAQLTAASHTCAVFPDAAIHCWGLNRYGQLGLNRNDNIGDDELPSLAGTVPY